MEDLGNYIKMQSLGDIDILKSKDINIEEVQIVKKKPKVKKK